MKTIRNWMLRWGGAFAALALVVATTTSGVTCWFASYQPKEPEDL